jgi:subtilase family serine protease
MQKSTLLGYLLTLLLGTGLLGLPAQQVQAQTYQMPITGSTSYSTCSGTLSDDGGPNGTYSSFANGSLTLTPATAGNKIRLDFTSFQTESGYDILYIYDGTSTGATLIGTYSGNTVPGIVYASTSSGALTMQFTTDGSVQGNGFTANVSCVTNIPQADLTVQAATITPTNTVAGNSISASSQIYNLSGSTANSSNLGYYLSTDNVLSSNDTFLSYSTGGSLGAGQSSSRSSFITIPTGTPAGTYYILFAADYLGQVPETNETNNVASVGIAVQASNTDLLIQSPTVSPTTVSVGSAISFNSYIYNQGNAAATNSSVGFYFSTNATLDANDQLLTSQYGSTLSALTSSQRSGTATVPAGTPAGNYYILVVADYQNQVVESNETNNVSAVSFTVVPPGPDLVITQASLYNTSVTAGTAQTASAYVLNQGNQSATSSNMGVYLSTNATFDGNDQLLTTSTGTALAAGISSYRSVNFTVPTTTVTGSYYVLFVADYQNQVVESTETNNVASYSLYVSAATVDLTVGSLSVSPTPTSAGSTITASCYLYNQGNSLASPATVGYYLSTDASLSSNDVLIGNSSGSVSSNNYTYRTGSATVPTGIPAGTYYVLFVADYLSQLAETNESNNVSSTTIQVITPGIDLSINSPSSSPSQVYVGNSLSTSGYLYNQGSLSTSAATVGYYLSTDNSLSSNDILIGTNGAITVGSSSYVSFYGTATIPGATAPGYYYVLFVADYLNQVTETNESNNVSSTSIQVVVPTVDLTMGSLSVSPTPTSAGSTITASCYLYNQGNSLASPATVGYYLSNDNSLSSNDVLIGSSSGTVSGSVSTYRTGSAIVPTNTPAGTYYVLFVADYLSQLAETNESNNVSSTTIQVVVPTIDLSINLPSSSPSQAYAGSTITASCYLYNQGNSPASPATVGYYLSNDNSLSSNDVLIGSSSGSVSGNISTYRSSSATVPAGTPAGTYYVLFVADYLSQLTETNESNNVSSTTIQVVVPTIDLIASSLSVSPTPTNAGSTITASCYLYNQGNSLASPATVGYYLSTDASLSSNDVLIGSSSGTVSGNTYIYRTGSAIVPTNTPAGTYYVLFVADYLSQLAETNESNNVSSTTIQVVSPYADLTINSASISQAQAIAGSAVNSTCTFSNLGNSSATPATIGYYLSTDNSFSSNDVLIGNSSTSVLGTNSSMSVYGTPTVPVNTANGTYYVLFVADYLNQVTESNKTNNIAFTTLQVVASTVDFTVQNPQLSISSVNPGGTLSGNCNLLNNGTASASSSTLGFYLSIDATFDSSDVLLGTTAGGTLAANASSYRTGSLTIPATTTAGTYYVLFVADPARTVTESDETNNTASLTLAVTGPFAGTIVPASGAATLTTCSARIYDNGGTGNYANNSNGTLTIFPGTTGAAVRLSFVSLDIEQVYDFLTIYDGPTTSARLLGTFSGSFPLGPFTASATNTTGALTIQFASNGSTTGPGFEATVSCVSRVPLANRDQTAGYEVSVVPNPVAGATPLRVELSGLGATCAATLTLRNSLGQLVANRSLALAPSRRNQVEIPTQGLATGVYILQLTGPDLNVVRRIVVE